MQRKCGFCKTPGHTRRNCPILINYRRSSNNTEQITNTIFDQLNRLSQERIYRNIFASQRRESIQQNTQHLKLKFLSNMDSYFKTDGECPVCLDNFSNNEFCGLTCLHQLCFKCTTEISKNDIVRCPICRVVVKEIHMPSGMSTSALNHVADVITG